MFLWSDERAEERRTMKQTRINFFFFFFFSSHLLNMHLKLSELTVAFARSFWPFKGVSHSVVESLTSGYEEENQTQLKAKGQRAQHHYDVNCRRYRRQRAFQKNLFMDTDRA